MERATVGVIGAGQMGSGIAQLFAQHNEQVIIYDVLPAQVDKALQSIQRDLESKVKKGTFDSKTVEDILSNVKAADLCSFKDCSLVVEAVSENEDLKSGLFRQLDEIMNKEAVMASNTSSISITRLAASTHRPDKVIGMHFMNPATIMQLVEVVRGQLTSNDTFNTAAAWVVKLGKSMAVSQDYPGFIVNRLLVPMLNEAIFALYEGVATAEDIDKSIQLGLRHPMGPLQLADFIGLDTLLAICNVLYDGFKDPKYRPCPLLSRMVVAGQLGVKSGRGFYSYEQDKTIGG